MKNIINIISLSLSIFANSTQAQTPPEKVPQSDGTIQLVPVPPATVFTPYFIDPSMNFRVLLESQWSNRDWNGNTKNGLVAKKNDVVEVRILAQPIPKTKLFNGKNISLWSVFRSGDFIVQWDSSKFELLPPVLGGFGYDPSVMNAAKSGIVAPSLSKGVNESALPQDGNLLFHAEALPVPEKRTPALKPSYFQWNFDGYLWQNNYRLLGTLRFKVKGDFYYPTSQSADIKIIPNINIEGVETKTSIDGGPIPMTNVLGETRNAVNSIQFGVGSDYRVSHKLSAPSTQFKIGDVVPVKVLVSNETLPQKISSVFTIFGWDNTKLEFIGIDKTGARPSQSSSIYMVGAGSVNEVAIPKDGNAAHNWLGLLGDKTYIDKDNVIVTLKFKVIAEFDSTSVSILQNNDPQLAGLTIFDQCGILGSSIPGAFVTGQTSNAAIKGQIN